MIFMRALLTDGLRVCQVKAYHTELGTTCLCMALTEIHDSKTHWISTLDGAIEIHDHIIIFMILTDKGCNPQRVRKVFRANLILACLLLPNFWPHSSPFTHH